MIIKTSPILHYDVSAFSADQQRHASASICLSENNGESHIQALADYMQDSKQSTNVLYHQARKNIHLNRPDAIKEALDKLEYTYQNDPIPSPILSGRSFVAPPAHQTDTQERVSAMQCNIL